MTHELEFNEDGSARMAYADREIPWHRLGTPMRGLQTAEAMLSQHRRYLRGPDARVVGIPPVIELFL